MGGRISFILVFPLLLVILAIWTHRVEQEGVGRHAMSELTPSAQDPGVITQRRELVEALDRIVSYENYYRNVYGHYTQLLSRAGVSIPPRLNGIFDIRVSDASAERLLVTAFSEVRGQVVDLVSIDQNCDLRANFPIPTPRPDYLRAQAYRQLRNLRGASDSTHVAESGVFRGYFRYEVRRDSVNQKTAFAVGIRPPVVGLQLEFGATQAAAFAEEKDGLPMDLTAEFLNGTGWGDLTAGVTGQKASEGLMSSTEETYLAQRIFLGEMGRYAKNWSELSRIAHFRFEGQDLLSTPGVPKPSPENRQLAEVKSSVLKNQDASRKSILTPSGLEIEPILTEE